MSRPDPLASLMKLRSLQVAVARRDLADRQAGAQAAAARDAAARDAIAAETGAEATGHADALAAWLPLARTALDRAAGEAALAGQAVEAARGALAQQRAQERAVEWLVEQRRAAARLAAGRAAQAALDESGQRRSTAPDSAAARRGR